MLLVLDLGFSSLVVLVVCAVFPLIGLVLRSKWRRIAARKEEIRRLIIVASEETARAELEASAGYDYSYGYTRDDGYSRSDGYAYTDGYSDGYGTVSPAQSNRCAVCHSPTTARCANCKAVWYWYVEFLFLKMTLIFDAENSFLLILRAFSRKS